MQSDISRNGRNAFCIDRFAWGANIEFLGLPLFPDPGDGLFAYRTNVLIAYRRNLVDGAAES